MLHDHTLSVTKGLQLTPDWRRNPGETVEIRRAGHVQRRGTVDAAMPDGSGLWLAGDGAFLRIYILKEDSLELWAEPL